MMDHQTNDNLIITWLSSSVINDQDLILSKNLGSDVHTFDYADSFADFVTNLIDQQKTIWIVSDSMWQSAIPLLHDVVKIHSIYIHSNNEDIYEEMVSQFGKVKGVFADLSCIRDAIEKSLLKAERESLSISVFRQDSFDPLSGENTRNRLDSSFMFSQILKSIILKAEFGQKEKQQLLDYLRTRYADNTVTLGVINEFEYKYSQHSPAWWYTRDTFLYRLLNHALRLQEMDVIWKFGFFIKDLHQQLVHLHAETPLKSRPTVVYRGQIIQNEEFEKLKNNKHGLIAFNTFLSTSTDLTVSSQYAAGALGDSNGKAILFEFHLDVSNESPFASLEHISYFEWEKEILFSMHTIFCIEEINQMDNGIWHVHLVMTNEDDKQLRKLTNYFQNELPRKGLAAFSDIMMKMGEYSKALEIYQTMLSEITEHDNGEMVLLHVHIGFCYIAMNDLDVAREHFEIAVDLATAEDPLLVPLLCRTGLGHIFRQQGKYDLALLQYESFLRLDLMELCFDGIMSLEFGHNMAANAYFAVASLLAAMHDYKRALEMNEKALKLYQRSGMPTMHPSTASVYNDIGLCHMHMENYELALPYLRKTVEFYGRALPKNHPYLASAHYNIAYCLKILVICRHNIESIFESIEHARRALEIAQITPELNSNIVLYQTLWDDLKNCIQIMENQN